MPDSLLLLFADHCYDGRGFFSLPTWYQYLELTHDPVGKCELAPMSTPEFIQSLPLIGVAALEIALRIAGFVAIGYVIYGGVQYVVAQGESDKLKKARQTIINALIGLVIAMISTGIVAFIGARIGE